MIDDRQEELEAEAQNYLIGKIRGRRGPDVVERDGARVTFQMQYTNLSGAVIDPINQDDHIGLVDAYLADDGTMRCTVRYIEWPDQSVV